MAEQWIEAATAYRVVAGVTNPPSLADEALCRRAREGLVTGRARVLVVGDRRSEDVLVPAEFWATGQRAGLKQHWAAGDFSGKIDSIGTDRWQAFGVTFALSGLLELLPFERRAATSRHLSVAGDAAWMTARDAVMLVSGAHGIGSGQAAILEQARLGFVTGRAVLARRFRDNGSAELLWEEREWNIPVWFWQSCGRGDSLQEWELGQLRGEAPARSGFEWMDLAGVHFLAESVQVLSNPPTGQDASQETSPKGRPGGRLPQSWWDDMWCDIWGLIHQGDFKPESQAEVERAMMTWAIKHDHQLAEATARPRARKLFKVYSGEATNFLGS